MDISPTASGSHSRLDSASLRQPFLAVPVAAACGLACWRWLAPWPDHSALLEVLALLSPLAYAICWWLYLMAWIGACCALLPLVDAAAGFAAGRRAARADLLARRSPAPEDLP